MTAPAPSRGALWLAAVAEEYDLPLGNAALARECADLIDRADALREIVASGPLVVESYGGRVAPAVGELRATQALLRQTLATLNLEDD